MTTRPRSRVRVVPPRLNMMTPTSTNIGAAADTSKDMTWTITVVPALAPRTTASAGTKSTRPPAVNDVTMSAVAVLLCSTAVIASPAQNAVIRLPRAVPRNRRRLGPKARWTPVWTMWTPQSNNAIQPASWARVNVVSIRFPPPPAPPP